MNEAHLRNIDLNLLLVLDSLLKTRSATRTARALGRSQSAVSHALARLREAFDDELLTRVGPRLDITPRAEALAPALGEVVARAGALFAGDDATFDGAKVARTFAIGATDFFEVLALPKLRARLAREAPRVDLVMRSPGDDIERSLLAGEVDLGFGTRFRALSGLTMEVMHREGLVMVARKNHPALKSLRARGASLPKVPLAIYVTLDHALVAPRGQPGGVVDVALEKLGHVRRVVLRLTHFLVAIHVVAKSDLVVTLPRSLASAMARVERVSVFEIPVEIEPFTFQLVHATARAREPGLAWFRRVVAEEFRAALA